MNNNQVYYVDIETIRAMSNRLSSLYTSQVIFDELVKGSTIITTNDWPDPKPLPKNKPWYHQHKKSKW